MNFKIKNIFLFCLSLFLALILQSCNKQVSVENINPSLVRLYMNEIKAISIERQSSFVALDFIATEDNGFLFIGVGGVGVSSKFNKNAVLTLMKIDNAGNLQWEKLYNDINLGFGYPSNILTVDVSGKKEYVLFWNKYVKTNNIDNFDYYKVQIKLEDSKVAPTIVPEKFSLEVRNNINTTNTKNGGYIVRAIQDNTDGYILMSVAANLNGIDNAQHIVLINRLSATLKTTWLQEPIIRGLSQGIESLKIYDNHFQLFGTNPYYYNIPDGSGVMSLSNIGGTQTPIFRDSSYWVSSVATIKNKTSLLLSAENQSFSYYVSSLDLAPNNYNAASITNLGTSFSPSLDNKFPATLSETSDGIVMICGTSQQKKAISFKITDTKNSKTKNFELANSSYVVANMVATSQESLFAIGGTYDFGQNWKRPFIILIPKTEVFK